MPTPATKLAITITKTTKTRKKKTVATKKTTNQIPAITVQKKNLQQ